MGFTFGQQLGLNVAGGIAGAAIGNWSARQGAGIDSKAKLGQESELYSRAMDRGLTPQEYYGSPAPGNPSASGAGQVIGNQSAQMGRDMAQLQVQQSENEKNRQNAKEIAKIQTGTTRRGQDISKEIADRAYQLDERKFEEVTLRESANQLRLQEHQIAKAANEVVTSEPKWHMMMKNLTMGSENMWVQSYIEHTGINPITDPESFRKLPKAERKKFLLGFLAFGSSTIKEISGLAELLGLDEFKNENPDDYVSLGSQNAPHKKENWKPIYENPFFTIKKRQ